MHTGVHMAYLTLKLKHTHTAEADFTHKETHIRPQSDQHS